ncbi:MAG: 2-oxoacid:acceptor oxidoreductase family protein [Spirochaetales bacterium]|nr:2-oxoacid:acceptor oxidoreductase family protein [Spirochaetales bacterium]
MLNIVFTGVGGQGVITAGIILAEAAVLEEGRHATQSQSYGAEARGGLTRTDVIISDREVLYPKIAQAHVLGALHQRGYTAHANIIRPGGMFIYDEETVKASAKTDARRIPIPLLIHGKGANMALLGAVCALTSAVKCQSIQEVIQRRYGAESSNLNAFQDGWDAVVNRGYTPHPAAYSGHEGDGVPPTPSINPSISGTAL